MRLARAEQCVKLALAYTVFVTAAGCGRAMDAKVAALRAGEDLTRTWLCVDMDAFFAACEELDNPALVHPQAPMPNLSFLPSNSDQWMPSTVVNGDSLRSARYGLAEVRFGGTRIMRVAGVVSTKFCKGWLCTEVQADGGGRHRHVLHRQLRGAQVWRALRHARLHRPQAVPRCASTTLVSSGMMFRRHIN